MWTISSQKISLLKMISKWDAKQESGKPIRWATAVVQRGVNRI
jgi:hypothetical protein